MLLNRRRTRAGERQVLLIDAHTHLRTGKLSGTPTPASAETALQFLQEDMELAVPREQDLTTDPDRV
jgi:hypothetical protein